MWKEMDGSCRRRQLGSGGGVKTTMKPLETDLGLGEEPGSKVRWGRDQAEFWADPGWEGGGQDRILGGASHIKAEILLFLKEIVENEFAHEVWVQCVVNHLGSSELGGREGWGDRA